MQGIGKGKDFYREDTVKGEFKQGFYVTHGARRACLFLPYKDTVPECKACDRDCKRERVNNFNNLQEKNNISLDLPS